MIALKEKKIVCIIPARGGSKGIPKKNIMDFCGEPLISWSIKNAITSKYIDKVFVSSDSDEILKISKNYGAETLKRPDEYSSDYSSSEDALIDAVNQMRKNYINPNYLVFLQATSPLRGTFDIDNAIELFFERKSDSLFSCARLEDHFIWEKNVDDNFISVTYDYNNRKRRQDIKAQYLENGSIYIMKIDILLKNKNRLGGKIGAYEMDQWKSHQIDSYEDVGICEYFMKSKILGERIKVD